MQYVDSNIFLYAALYSPDSEPKARKAKEILRSIELGELEAATSTLTWDEVVWVATKTLGRADGIRQGQKLIGFPNLEFVNADESVITQAQTLMGKYNLSPRDAIHLASALSRKAIAIVSDDEDFDQIKEIKRIPF
jgi:uncharacterized protein